MQTESIKKSDAYLRFSDLLQGERIKAVKRPGTKAGLDLAALDDLIEETSRVYQRLAVAAEQVHRKWDVSAGKRAVLRMIDKNGPQTVPQMARARCVSRQHIQALVNALIEAGLLTLEPNPAHRRSCLIDLTPKGRAVVEAINAREAEVADLLRFDLTGDQMRAATATLKRLRSVFEGTAWQRIVGEEDDDTD